MNDFITWKYYLSILVALAFTCCSSASEATNSDKQNDTIADTVTAALPSLVTPQQPQFVDTVYSAKMKRGIACTVTVPQSYLTTGDTTKFPVVYLLHGYGDTNKSWPEKYDLKTAATKYGIIIVCPDGQNSWYLDSPIDPTMQFETFIAQELVSHIDSCYRTRANLTSRAITGLSMGGHGALYLAFRHPEVFGSCGSMSGGVDITKFPDRWLIHKRLGRYNQSQKVWAQHSVINHVDRIKPGQLNIIVDDGRQDFFYEVNMALHKKLNAKGIDHTFAIRPGAHTWTYWRESLPIHLNFFHKAFTGTPIPPTTSIPTDTPKSKSAPNDTVKKSK